LSIYEKLQKIQAELEVPKSQFNSFGNYHYRSCEDILSAVKPVAAKYDCVVKVSDEMVEVGGRCYVKATARLIDCGEANTVSVEATGYAREEETKKGMDAAQITGAASSYARKYALNGLFCLDDVKDSDATNKPETTKHAAPADFDENCDINEADIPKTGTKADQVRSGCEVCDAELTQAAMNVSKHKFNGKVLCLKCQKEEN
jgi:hypothetical protein